MSSSPVDDRIFQQGQVLLQMVVDCLGERCHAVRAVFPKRPSLPCDYIAVFTDPVNPLSIQSAVNFDETDDGGPVGEFFVHWIVRSNRCCALPQVDHTGKGWSVPTRTQYETAAQNAHTDLLTIWQCLLCSRGELFGEGSCGAMRMSSSAQETDTCIAWEINVELALDSRCCPGPGCS